MSTRRSLRLGDAALWDSPLECGDISMDCLSHKMHFPTPGKKHTKKNKIGQQNLAGGRSDEARFSRWLRLLSKGEEKSGALSAIHGGSSQEHIYMNQGDMTESPPNGKNVMNYTRTANEAERQKGDEK